MMFVYRLNRRPETLEVLEHITQDAENGEVLIVTSAFTTAEVGKVENCETDEEQERMIADFFENEYLRVMPVTRAIAAKSREILRLGGIKGKDAIHVATACLTPGIQVMHTYDKDIIKKSGKIPGSDLIIASPNWNYLPDMTYKRPLGIFADLDEE